MGLRSTYRLLPLCCFTLETPNKQNIVSIAPSLIKDSHNYSQYVDFIFKQF